MNVEMFEELIKAIDSTDWISNWIQIGMVFFNSNTYNLRNLDFKKRY